MTAKRLRLSGRARRDLIEIFRHSREHWGLAKARSYVAVFDEAFQRIARNPGLGKLRTGRSGEFRSWHCQRHLILYEVEDDRLVILHILHERMDMTSRTGLSEEAAAYAP